MPVRFWYRNFGCLRGKFDIEQRMGLTKTLTLFEEALHSVGDCGDMKRLKLYFRTYHRRVMCLGIAAASMVMGSMAVISKDKEALQSPGLVREFNGSLDEVRKAVLDVQHDQIIHGTLMFDKDPVLSGAEAVERTPLFEPWTGEGTVYYKIRSKVIAPRHFVESGDQGTIGVRYVVILVNEDRVRVRIDAVYGEAFHHVMHPSDGTVEKSEMKEIKDRVDSLQQAVLELAESRRRKESADLVRQSYVRQREDETTKLSNAESEEQRLKTELDGLRHELERRVKAPGADLKAAPFRSAATLKPLAAYTELVVLIVTPNWLGVETPEGQRGWISVDRLELLP
jgi:hypothetical protein